MRRLLCLFALMFLTIGIAKAQSLNVPELYQPAGNAVAGNPNGKITVVEFFDYNCGFCRKIYPELHQLLQKDHNIRLIFRDYPILSELSIPPAQAALAAQKQSKYLAMQNAMMTATKPLDEKEILSLAQGVGLNTKELSADMSSPSVLKQIDANLLLGRIIGLRGTPTFIIVKTPPEKTAHPVMISGPSIDELQKLINQVASEN